MPKDIIDFAKAKKALSGDITVEDVVEELLELVKEDAIEDLIVIFKGRNDELHVGSTDMNNSEFIGILELIKFQILQASSVVEYDYDE